MLMRGRCVVVLTFSALTYCCAWLVARLRGRVPRRPIAQVRGAENRPRRVVRRHMQAASLRERGAVPVQMVGDDVLEERSRCQSVCSSSGRARVHPEEAKRRGEAKACRPAKTKHGTLDLVAVCKIRVSSDKGKTYEMVNFLGAVKRTASKRTSARWP